MNKGFLKPRQDNSCRWDLVRRGCAMFCIWGKTYKSTQENCTKSVGFRREHASEERSVISPQQCLS